MAGESDAERRWLVYQQIRFVGNFAVTIYSSCPSNEGPDELKCCPLLAGREFLYHLER